MHRKKKVKQLLTCNSECSFYPPGLISTNLVLKRSEKGVESVGESIQTAGGMVRIQDLKLPHIIYCLRANLMVLPFWNLALSWK